MAGKIQHGSRNYAGGSDVVAMQVGTVKSEKRTETKKAEAKKPEEQNQGESRVTNIRSGNATVGFQADEIHGEISIRL